MINQAHVVLEQRLDAVARMNALPLSLLHSSVVLIFMCSVIRLLMLLLQTRNFASRHLWTHNQLI